MRKILVAVFLLVSLVSFGQFPSSGLIQFPKTNGIGYRGVGGDSLVWLPSDTLQPASSLINRRHIAIKGGVTYYWDGAKWTTLSAGGTGTVTSIATGYGLSGGTITTTGTLLWDSATAYLTGLRRKDSATGTNLNGYLTRTYYESNLKRFGVSGEDNSFTQNRYANGNNLYGFDVDQTSYTSFLSDNNVGAQLRMRLFHGEDSVSLIEISSTGNVSGGHGEGGLYIQHIGYGDTTNQVTLHSGGVPTQPSRGQLGTGTEVVLTPQYLRFNLPSSQKMIIDRLPSITDTTGYQVLFRKRSDSTLAKGNASIIGGGGSTPTFQQTLTAGSTLTGDNTIAGGGHSLTFDNNNTVTINAVSGAVTNSLIVNGAVVGINATNGSASYSEIAMSPTAITINPNLGSLAIDTLAAGGAFSDSFMVWHPADGYVKKLDGSKVVSTTGTQTLTNKRWTPRVGSTTSSATPTINTDNVDIYKLTAQAADITSMTTNLSGTPVDGDVLEIQITGTAARAITWGTSFVSSTVTLPTTTVTTATLTVILQYYTTSSYGNNKWVCVNYY